MVVGREEVEERPADVVGRVHGRELGAANGRDKRIDERAPPRHAGRTDHARRAVTIQVEARKATTPWCKWRRATSRMRPNKASRTSGSISDAARAAGPMRAK